MEPVLFIHGFAGGRFHYLPIEIYLKRKGLRKTYEFNYEKRFGEISLSAQAKKLDNFIKRNVKEKQISIVAISQGGLIAKYYIQNYKNNVNKCVTVCTPFKGVWWAKLSSRPGLKDLSYQSKFIKDIESKSLKKKVKTKFYSIWTPFDIIVPESWAGPKSILKKKMVLAPGHHLAFWSLGTLKFVYNSLKEKN